MRDFFLFTEADTPCDSLGPRCGAVMPGSLTAHSTVAGSAHQTGLSNGEDRCVSEIYVWQQLPGLWRFIPDRVLPVRQQFLMASLP